MGQSTITVTDDSFDAATVAFGIRNVSDLDRGIAEMARVVRPGGWVLAEFYNARSVRRLVKAIKPAQKVSDTTHDTAVYTRYDDAEAIRSYLPPELTWVTSRGIRVVTPAAVVHKVPLVGTLVRAAEERLCDVPVARDLGGFLVVCAQKRV